ncbi:uncharacterized protein BKA78DRAFT_7511 [Phyllosticta capitalensis]|uniref:uncharacterized protein n=1 Tax=Phyllosticta capitalensis TaxID=121624 RepID=UPI003130B8AC
MNRQLGTWQKKTGPTTRGKHTANGGEGICTIHPSSHLASSSFHRMWFLPMWQPGRWYWLGRHPSWESTPIHPSIHPSGSGATDRQAGRQANQIQKVHRRPGHLPSLQPVGRGPKASLSIQSPTEAGTLKGIGRTPPSLSLSRSLSPCVRSVPAWQAGWLEPEIAVLSCPVRTFDLDLGLAKAKKQSRAGNGEQASKPSLGCLVISTLIRHYDVVQHSSVGEKHLRQDKTRRREGSGGWRVRRGWLGHEQANFLLHLLRTRLLGVVKKQRPSPDPPRRGSGPSIFRMLAMRSSTRTVIPESGGVGATRRAAAVAPLDGMAR